MNILVSFAVILLGTRVLIDYSHGQCTFPAELQDIWTTGKRGNLTITDEFIFNFPIDDVGTFSFKCTEKYGERYILKTTNTFPYIDPSLIFSALICFDFQTISDDLYIYYMGSKLSATGRIYYSLNDAPWNASDVCFTAPGDYEPQSYEVMIRNGNIDAVKRSCPSSLRAYWAYNFDKGSGNLCPNERSLDVCQSGQVLFNYTQCDTSVAYSANGLLYCVYSVTNGDVTYVTLWNDDDVVDDTNTHRMSCWAYAKSGNDMVMTQHPEICGDNQNATYVDMSVGAQLLLFNKTVCSPTTPEDLTWLYITIGCVLGFLFIVALVVCIYYFHRYKAKQKPFRGGLEPANMLSNGTTFKLASGIPESDAPINVMQLLRKEAVTPGGRDTPSSTFDVTVKTPPQIFNIREIDSYGPSPTKEITSLKKDYHILGGADQSEYGDLPMDDERSTKTPVMVLPLKSPGVALEQEDDDYDDDDDDELMMPTPGRSSLVSAKTGAMWEDPMCPATRLPGIVEDYHGHPGNSSSRVGCAKPVQNGVITNITFIGEDNRPLPPRTPTPPGTVETIRDANSKLRVKVKRRASLTNKPILPNIDSKGRGTFGDETLRESRGQDPERGEDSSNMDLVFTVPVLHPKLAIGIGPAASKPTNINKGGKNPGAQLKSRMANLDSRRGEPERKTKGFSPRTDSPRHEGQTKCTPRKAKLDKDTKKGMTTPRKNKIDIVVSYENSNKKPVIGDGVDGGTQEKRIRPKSVAGTKDSTHASALDEETTRPASSLRMTRVDIPDLSPPIPGPSANAVNNNEIIDSPTQTTKRSSESSSSDGKEKSQPRKLWLDPVRPTTDLWCQMSSVWRQGQAWPDKK